MEVDQKPAAFNLGIGPTHPEDENFAGNLWLGEHLPGRGCRGPSDAPGYLTQPSGLP